jgi:LacI family transcriptional regulator
MKKEKESTIYDVARIAKVSIATVSRVFNKSSLVTDRTVAHVLEVAKKLNFSPSASARGLSGGKQETIGIILPVLYGNLFSEFIYSIQALAEARGYDIVVAGQKGSPEEFFATVKKLSTKIDGLILMYHIEGIKKEMARRFPKLPNIVLSRFVKYREHVDLVLDNYSGAFMATEHLITQGNRKIALIKGEEGNIDAIERTEGFLSAVHKFGIKKTDVEILEGTFRQISGYNAVQELFLKRKDISAIFASNDAMALGALNWMHRYGMKIPEDVEICGFDDIEFAQMTRPSLSSVYLNTSLFGQKAFEMIMEMISEKRIEDTPKQLIIDPELRVRESSSLDRSK